MYVISFLKLVLDEYVTLREGVPAEHICPIGPDVVLLTDKRKFHAYRPPKLGEISLLCEPWREFLILTLPAFAQVYWLEFAEFCHTPPMNAIAFLQRMPLRLGILET